MLPTSFSVVAAQQLRWKQGISSACNREFGAQKQGILCRLFVTLHFPPACSGPAHCDLLSRRGLPRRTGSMSRWSSYHRLEQCWRSSRQPQRSRCSMDARDGTSPSSGAGFASNGAASAKQTRRGGSEQRSPLRGECSSHGRLLGTGSEVPGFNATSAGAVVERVVGVVLHDRT